MPFGLFRSQCSPVLADFGASGVKLLQLSSGDPERIVAAATIDFGSDMRGKSLESRMAHIATALPAALRSGGFRGKRVVVAPFTQHTLVQHVTLPPADAASADDVIRTRVAVSLGCDPAELIVRTSVVAETMRDGEPRVETIAFAMTRQDVMRYVTLFRRAGLSVVGVHSHIAALVHAFDKSAGSERSATMYVDIGYGATKVAICHGRHLVFAKTIAFAGRNLEAKLAAAHGGDVVELRNARMKAGLSGHNDSNGAPSALEPSSDASIQRHCPVALATRDAVDGLAEELSMCARYHGALCPEQPIEHVVVVGGESSDQAVCQALEHALHLSVESNDPLAAAIAAGAASGLPKLTGPHPGWAVAYGLSKAPTDL